MIIRRLLNILCDVPKKFLQIKLDKLLLKSNKWECIFVVKEFVKDRVLAMKI